MVMPPHIQSRRLYFGYAIYENKLVRCSFFVTAIMVNDVIGDVVTIPTPCLFVIDPLAIAGGKVPECYVGVSVEQEDIESWVINRKPEYHPLELYVARIAENQRKEKEQQLQKVCARPFRPNASCAPAR